MTGNKFIVADLLLGFKQDQDDRGMRRPLSSILVTGDQQRLPESGAHNEQRYQDRKLEHFGFCVAAFRSPKQFGCLISSGLRACNGVSGH